MGGRGFVLARHTTVADVGEGHWLAMSKVQAEMVVDALAHGGTCAVIPRRARAAKSMEMVGIGKVGPGPTFTIADGVRFRIDGRWTA